MTIFLTLYTLLLWPAFFFLHFQESIHYSRVEMAASQRLNMFHGPFFRPRSAISTIAGQGIPNIHDGKYAGLQRNLFAAQAAWITCAIPFFMMAVGDIDGPA